MQRWILSAALAFGFTAPATAQIFDQSKQILIKTTGAVIDNGEPVDSADTINFTTGTAGAQGISQVDGHGLVLTMSVVNATTFATDGSQWLVFEYFTQGFVPIGAPGSAWSITEAFIPVLQSGEVVEEFTQFLGDNLSQPTASIFGNPGSANIVPGFPGDGELGFDVFASGVAGFLPTLGASVGDFQTIINAYNGQVPFGFIDAYEFTPSVFTPPGGGTGTGSAAPEPSTWAMLIMGFGLMAGLGYRRAWKVAARAPLTAA